MTRQHNDKDYLEARVPVAELSESDLEIATGGVGSGGGAGKVMHSDLQCQKYLDRASITL